MTTAPEPEPKAYDINDDFRRAPPVRREAHVVVPKTSALSPGSMFDIHLQAESEKRAEERALKIQRKAARDKKRAEKEEKAKAAGEEPREPKPKKGRKERTAEEKIDDEKHSARREAEKARADKFLLTGCEHSHALDGQICGEDVVDFAEVLEITDEHGEVRETFLRTDIHPMFRHFNSIMPRAHRLKVGRDKGFVKTYSRKVLSLVQPYITQGANGMYGCIIVELDSTWPEVKVLLRALQKRLPQHMMPNFVVSRGKDGRPDRPHLVWMLASPVYWNPPRVVECKSGRKLNFGDPRCVEGSPLHSSWLLLRRINLGLTKLLVEIGADPAQTNVHKFKNPLSIHSSTVVSNGENLHYLSVLDGIPGLKDIPGLDMDVRFGEVQAAVEAKNNEPSVVSQPEFVACRAETSRVLAQAMASRDPEYLNARQNKVDLEAWIVKKTMPKITQAWGNSIKVQKLVRSSAKRFATTHDPRRAGTGSKAANTSSGQPTTTKKKAYPARGRYRNLGAAVPPVNAGGVRMSWLAREARMKKLQGISGAQSASIRHAKSMWEAKKHLAEWQVAGVTMEKTALIKRLAAEGILGKSAGYAHWNELAAFVAKNSASVLYCKKGPGSSFSSTPKSSSSRPSYVNDAPRSGDPDINRPEPAAEGPPDPPRQTDDRASASNGRQNHEPPQHRFHIVEASNVGENPASHQPIYIVVRNAALSDYAQAA